MAILTKKIKKFHKSKVDGLKKLATKTSLFYDLLQFKGCPFTKGKMSEKSVVEFLKIFPIPIPISFE